MKIMPDIKLSEEQVREMLLIYTRRYGESFICNPRLGYTLYKIFCKEADEEFEDEGYIHYHPKIEDIIDMSENKLKKLEKLFSLQLEHSVIPISTLSMNGHLIGYEMTYDFNDMALNPSFLRRRELVCFLEQSKSILQYFASHDIIYGDVANRNILVNRKTGTVKFCDMDNICLGQYPIDKMEWELEEYCEQRGKLDSQADAYMHSLMTLSDLGINIYANTLNRARLKKRFTKEAIPIVETISQPERFNGEYIIQYVKK